MGFWGDGMGWMMMFGGLWMLVFWGVIIALIVWGVIRLTRSGGGKASNPREQISPLDIARERYAKGDISHEEFTEIQRNLK
jgi:putative membrane protein